MAKTLNSPLSEAYLQTMADRYDPTVVEAFASEWSQAPISRYLHYIEEYQPYVRVTGSEPLVGQKPVFFVRGFSEGITSKAPHAAEMASLGFDYILPGVNRRRILKNDGRKLNATEAEAEALLAIIEAENLQNRPLDFVAHSYGSLIFDAMHKEGTRRGWTCFDEAKVVFLAPAGSYEKENPVSLGYRFGKKLISAIRAEKKLDYPDSTKERFQAATSNLLANVPRTIKEVWRLARDKVEYDRLLSSAISRLAIFGYAEDALFTHKQYEATVRKHLDGGLIYATPISLELTADRKIRGGDLAVHDDEEGNPTRVARAVAQFLRQA